jgi:ribosomal protein S18 acetylase RimI-like enzyme
MEFLSKGTPADNLKAMEENLWSLWSLFGKGHGCLLHEDGDLLYFDTPIRTLPYNGVIRSRLTEDAADERIDAIFAHYHNRGMPFFWLVHPSATPHDLGKRLEARGFNEVEACPGMTIDLADLPDPVTDAGPGIHIREALTEEDLGAIYELIAWRWEVPPEVKPLLPEVTHQFPVGSKDSPLRTWIAWHMGMPVSKVVMNLDAGVAGIYGVATKPEVRGLGLARKMTVLALHTARDLGYRMGVLESSEMAMKLYSKVGFSDENAPFRVYCLGDSFHI